MSKSHEITRVTPGMYSASNYERRQKTEKRIRTDIERKREQNCRVIRLGGGGHSQSQRGSKNREGGGGINKDATNRERIQRRLL